MTYVAVNLGSRVYLRKSKNNWYTTTDGTSAFHHSARKQMENAIENLKNHGISTDGWMVVSTKEASKLLPRRSAVDILLFSENEPQKSKPKVETPIISTQATENSLAIIEKIKEIHQLMSSERMSELSKQLSDADKMVSDIYHYIEISHLNACQGYKAYRKLQDALKVRRGIKNEMAVISHIKQCGITDIARIENIAGKAWKAERDIFNN